MQLKKVSEKVKIRIELAFPLSEILLEVFRFLLFIKKVLQLVATFKGSGYSNKKRGRFRSLSFFRTSQNLTNPEDDLAGLCGWSIIYLHWYVWRNR
jgi:hypothetical protein